MLMIRVKNYNSKILYNNYYFRDEIIRTMIVVIMVLVIVINIKWTEGSGCSNSLDYLTFMNPVSKFDHTPKHY